MCPERSCHFARIAWFSVPTKWLLLGQMCISLNFFSSFSGAYESMSGSTSSFASYVSGGSFLCFSCLMALSSCC